MRWVTAVRRLLLQWLKRGRGQREARGRRRDRTALAFQPRGSGAACPGRRLNRSKTVLRRVAERWPIKVWGRPQDIDAGSQVREQRVVCAHCCVGEPVEVTSKR